MARMREIRAAISPHDSTTLLTDLGVDVFFGSARFEGGNVISINGSEATLKFKKACIATGGTLAELSQHFYVACSRLLLYSIGVVFYSN
jgi:pyruvate/2-oxoglutarate dehydrogenase complex dihydrolipoamide dehydrogenase (E3) component